MAPPALQNYQYQFADNGVLMNADAQIPPWIDVSAITGLDAGFVRISTRERESVDGSYIDASHMSSRTIVLEGTLYANTNDPDTVLDQLRANYGPTAIDFPFYFQHPNKPLRMCIGRGGGLKYTVDTARRVGQTSYQATILCSTPFIYDAIPYVSQCSTIPTPSANQINVNATFEGGLGVANWTGSNGATISQSGTQFHSGAFSMQLTPNGTTANPTTASEQQPVTAGDTYTGDIWVLSPIAWASGVTLFVNEYTSTGTTLGSIFGGTGALAANTWTRLIITGDLNIATVAKGNLVLQVNGTPPASQNFFFDDCFFYAAGGRGFPTGPFNVGFGAASPSGFPLFGFGAVVANNGTHASYPIFTLTGPLTNPQIQDTQHGVLMQFNITLNAGDKLVIDNFSRSVTLNGTVSRRNALQGLQWASVNPGSLNTFVLTSTGGNGTLSVLNYSTYF